MRAVALLLLAACAEDPEPDFGVVCGDGVRDDVELCDDGNSVSGDGCSDLCMLEPLVTVAWEFYPSLGGPPSATCPANVTTVELVTEVNTSAAFPCDERRSGTIHVPVTKQVFARLRAANGDVLAESVPQRAPSSWRTSAPFYEDAGYVRVSFPCSGNLFELTLTPTAGGEPITLSAACVTMPIAIAVSRAVVAGTYDVALTSAGVVHSAPGITVRPNNGITDLDFR
jgi:cysteine-rich repeat protein